MLIFDKLLILSHTKSQKYLEQIILNLMISLLLPWKMELLALFYKYSNLLQKMILDMIEQTKANEMIEVKDLIEQ